MPREAPAAPGSSILQTWADDPSVLGRVAEVERGRGSGLDARQNSGNGTGAHWFLRGETDSEYERKPGVFPVSTLRRVTTKSIGFRGTDEEADSVECNEMSCTHAPGEDIQGGGDEEG